MYKSNGLSCFSDIGVSRWCLTQNTAQKEITWQAINLIHGRKDRAETRVATRGGGAPALISLAAGNKMVIRRR